MENYVFLRSFVASILVPSNCLCFDSNSSHTLGGKQATHSHTHTHTHTNCHKIMICLCNVNSIVGIEVLRSASILVHNLSFTDSYRLIQLDSWAVVTMVVYSQDYLFSGPCHSSHIENMNTFGVWICSFLRCGGHLLGWE